ncbi:MAG TPA: hypothetical protein VHC22_23715 [Pirellulales bacterium]|nr:hypothetical protein [Pirellulales bacterium]
MNIECRLARLEAQNRWLRVVALAALVSGVLPWVMGNQAEVPENIQARRFTLIGDDETPVGTWEFDAATKGTSLSVQSAKASPAVVLTSSPDESTIRLSNGIRVPPQAIVPPQGRRRDVQPSDADIALTTGKTETTIKMNDGSIAIYRHGNTAFVAPPKSSILPVTEK